MSKRLEPGDAAGVELREICAVARKALEPGLAVDGNGTAISEGACLYACLLLGSMLLQFTSWAVGIRGGSGLGASGAQAADGTWHGHFWVVVKGAEDSDDNLVLDITGDQFGHDPISVLDAAQASGRFAAGDQQEVDAQVTALMGSLPMGGLHVRDGWLHRRSGHS